MSRTKSYRAIFKWIGTLCLVLIGFSTAGAQELFKILQNPRLDDEQKHYLKYIKENPMNHSLQFIEVNMGALKQNSFIFQPNSNESYLIMKTRRGEQYAGLTSWCGTIDDGRNFGDVNMVVDRNNLVGHFTIGNRIFAISPIGKGIHVFYGVDSSLMPLEECYSRQKELEETLPDASPKVDNPDLLLKDLGAPKSTGECKIRVLVGFTDSVQQRYLSLSAEIVNLFNLSNAAFDNAEVGFNIELAMAYEVDYVETDSLGKDLTRWRLPNDGFMDEVHSNRTLFDADMCALLINDSGGLARISLDYNQTFSVTGADNFNIFTFHHELGHNMLCLHDLINTDQPGTAPYAGYGEPNNSCFRTIMAYQEACGSAFGCDRVNVFSRSIGTFNCNGIDYAKGGVNNRNRDRLVLSKDVINNHTTVFTNITYGGDYNWRNDESVNFVAEETVGYESTTDNRWDMFNGSTGSFRASEEITLGEGFWARTGSTFSAYLESCEDITGNAAEDPTFDLIVTNANTNQSTAKDNTKYVHNLSVFPNPFRESTNVIFELDENTHSVTISVKDLLGKEVIQITHVVELNAGQHVIEVQTADLPNGIYLLTLQAGEEVMVERIIKGN